DRRACRTARRQGVRRRRRKPPPRRCPPARPHLGRRRGPLARPRRRRRRHGRPALADVQQPEAWTHFQRYPVIYLTFKDVKANTYALALSAIRAEIAQAYEDHRDLLDAGR